MSVERTALRQLHSVAMSIYDIGNREKMDARAYVMDEVPALLDDLDAKDRRIAELEAGNAVKDALARELDADLAASRKSAESLRGRLEQSERAGAEIGRRLADADLRLSIATESNELRRAVDTLQAQIEAVAPVVDAAVAWDECKVVPCRCAETLNDAIDAYRAELGKELT